MIIVIASAVEVYINHCQITIDSRTDSEAATKGGTLCDTKIGAVVMQASIEFDANSVLGRPYLYLAIWFR